jgi:hypothetical protein
METGEEIVANPELSEVKRREIERMLSQGKSHRQVATECNVGIGTVSNVKSESGIAQDLKTARATEQARIAQSQYRDAIGRIDSLTQELKLLRSLDGTLSQINPIVVTPKSARKRHTAVPFLLASDWHADETVDKRAMNGLNEFNLVIARKRVKTLFEAVVDILRIYASNSDTTTLVIAAIGDFMSSWIHDELVETNSLTPPMALLAVLDMWTGGIDYILSSGVIQDILIVGAVGNHGRITRKPQSKNRTTKNYEWILYSLLGRYYVAKGEKRVRVQMPQGYFNYLEILGHTIRCHHGDAIHYQGGIGGVHIPLKKAIAMWNKAKRADLDLLGHWHQCEFSRDYIINGSLIGYSEYAEIIKAEPEPAQQAMFLLHNKYGHTGFYPLKVQ